MFIEGFTADFYYFFQNRTASLYSSWLKHLISVLILSVNI